MKELNNNKSPLVNVLKFNLLKFLTMNTTSIMMVKTKIAKNNIVKKRK